MQSKLECDVAAVSRLVVAPVWNHSSGTKRIQSKHINHVLFVIIVAGDKLPIDAAREINHPKMSAVLKASKVLALKQAQDNSKESW